MDFINKFTHQNEAGGSDAGGRPGQVNNSESGGIMGKLSSAFGGGESGEKKEDGLDKAVDFFQEHVLKAGPQNNESAMEQLKDEQISDTIRSTFKNVTGRDFPIADK